MIYLKLNPDNTIQYASATPVEGLIPYSGPMPEFPTLDDGSTAGWVGYHLVGGQLEFNTDIWQAWVATHQISHRPMLLADTPTADIRQLVAPESGVVTPINGWVAGIPDPVPFVCQKIGPLVYVMGTIKNLAATAGASNCLSLQFPTAAYVRPTVFDVNGKGYRAEINNSILSIRAAVPANTVLYIVLVYGVI